jgi:hypothetical protein
MIHDSNDPPAEGNRLPLFVIYFAEIGQWQAGRDKLKTGWTGWTGYAEDRITGLTG